MTESDKGRAPREASEHRDVEQIARLMRYSRDGSLSEKSRDVVKYYILQHLGVAAPAEAPEQPSAKLASLASEPVPQPKVEPKEIPTKPPRLVAAFANPQPAPGISTEQPHIDQGPKDAELYFQIELKVRHLVEADAEWELIEPYIYEMLRLHDHDKTVAKVTELAFLRAKQTELEKFVSNIRGVVSRSWMAVHEAVRAHLVVRFWRCGGSHVLAPIVFRYKDHPELQPIERLFVLHSLTGSRDASVPWIFFKQYRSEIEDAVRSLGNYVGMDENRFYLEIGKVAVDLGFEKEARHLFERIAPESNEHEDALQLILHASTEQNKSRKSHYVELLLSHGDPMERLRLLSGFLDNTRGLGGFRDRNRPALNELLEKPVEWLQPHPEVARRLAEILVSNRDLEPLLPNLFNFFRENALKFHGKDSELAIWGVLSEMQAVQPADRYWKALGHLHIYANTGPANEVLLWRARELVAQARETQSTPLLYEWRVLHKTVYSWVAKSPFLIETERQKMLAQMRIAISSEFLVLGDVTDYLGATERISLEVADHLLQLCREKKSLETELQVLNKRAMASHFTNAQLNRVWQIATLGANHDLAWRTASVINARGYLHPSVRHPWEISGEKRAAYPINTLNKKVVAVCVRGLPHAAQKIAWALINVGGQLPELLSCLDRGASVARVASYPNDSLERKAEEAINRLGWLPPLRKRYKFSFDATSGHSKVPAFAQVLPANLWAIIVAHLAERLGINAFQWKMSFLHDQIIDLVPRMAGRQDLKRNSSKVAKWLKDLAPEQRSAWYDLAALSRAMDDDTARTALAVFVTRLATAIYQNHILALTSLQAMRADVEVIWMLESWILSDGYQAVRKDLGYESRVPVPMTLLKLDSVISGRGNGS